MNDHPRNILCNIIQKEGDLYFKETSKLRNLLNDLCNGNYKRERRCIIDSISEGIPSELLDAQECIPYNILSEQLTNRLINCGYDPQLARWTVDSWAQAFRIVTPSTTLFIVANPPEAKIFLNERLIGISPLEIKSITSGHYDIRIALDGYDIWQKSIDIASGQKITINANLIRTSSYGEIFIDSNPRGAVIFIDSQHHGATPKKIKGLPVGPHQISFTSEGYEKYNKSVNIQTGKNPDLTVALIPSVQPIQTGQISVDSYPSNADIYLDSAYQGQTPKVLRGISLGNHKIELKMRGFSSYFIEMAIHHGKNPDIFWKTKKIREPVLNKKLILGAVIAIASIYVATGPLLAPFLGLITIPMKLYPSQPAAFVNTTQTPIPSETILSGATFLPENQLLDGWIVNEESKTYYFDVINSTNIFFIRVTVDGSPLTDIDFIVGNGYVPTFNPPHYDIDTGGGTPSQSYDIRNPTSGRYYVVIKNTGSSGSFTISKSIFYNS